MSISPCKFGRRDATLGQKQKGGLMLMKPPSAVDEMIHVSLHVSLHAVKTLIPVLRQTPPEAALEPPRSSRALLMEVHLLVVKLDHASRRALDRVALCVIIPPLWPCHGPLA